MALISVADSLPERLVRVLQVLRRARGTISGARAFELRIRRDQVRQLRDLGLVQIDESTHDLELTADGDWVLNHLDPDDTTDTDGDPT